jgi:hypothetical protein
LPPLNLDGALLFALGTLPLPLDMLLNLLGPQLACTGSLSLSPFSLTCTGKLTLNDAITGKSFTLSQGTFNATVSNNQLKLTLQSAVTLDLGIAQVDVTGSVYSDGTFEFDGSTNDITVKFTNNGLQITIGPNASLPTFTEIDVTPTDATIVPAETKHFTATGILHCTISSTSKSREWASGAHRCHRRAGAPIRRAAPPPAVAESLVSESPAHAPVSTTLPKLEPPPRIAAAKTRQPNQGRRCPSKSRAVACGSIAA